MSRLLLPMLLSISLPLFAADKAPPISATYSADPVADGVHVIHGPMAYPNADNQGFMNNPGIVLTDAGVVVIDPGSSVQTGEMVLAHVRKLTDQPVVAVFNSHVHGDHWLGNQAIVEAFPDVPVYAHPRLLERVEQGAGRQWIDLFTNLTDGAIGGTEVVGPNRPVTGGDELVIGGLTFRMLTVDGKAHTDTDIMIQLVEREVIFLGDNGLYRRIARMDDGSFAGNIAALDLALESGAAVFVPGHGRSGGEEAASRYRDYLDRVYAEVQRYYEEGLADFEIKPKLLPLLAEWKPWFGFDDEVGRHVSIAYLEAEAADF